MRGRHNQGKTPGCLVKDGWGRDPAGPNWVSCKRLFPWDNRHCELENTLHYVEDMCLKAQYASPYILGK